MQGFRFLVLSVLRPLCLASSDSEVSYSIFSEQHAYDCGAGLEGSYGEAVSDGAFAEVRHDVTSVTSFSSRTPSLTPSLPHSLTPSLPFSY